MVGGTVAVRKDVQTLQDWLAVQGSLGDGPGFGAGWLPAVSRAASKVCQPKPEPVLKPGLPSLTRNRGLQVTQKEECPQFNSWFRFQRYAKDNGFDSVRFCAFLPAGPMMGRWLDAYMGLIKFDDLDGFVTVDQLDEIAPDALCIVQPSLT